MGKCKNRLDFQQNICEGDGVFIPAGTWHNIINIEKTPLKISSIYAPLNHFKRTSNTKNIRIFLSKPNEQLSICILDCLVKKIVPHTLSLHFLLKEQHYYANLLFELLTSIPLLLPVRLKSQTAKYYRS